MPPRKRSIPEQDPNALEGEETRPAGDQSPRFPRLTKDEELRLLTEAPAPEVAALPDHALDGAAQNSKIIVVSQMTGRKAVLATPDGPVMLPDGDIAHKLPIGTKVYKVSDGRFTIQMPQEYEYATPEDGARAAEVLAAAVSLMERKDQAE